MSAGLAGVRARTRPLDLEDQVLELVFTGKLGVGVQTSEEQILGLLRKEGDADLSRTPLRIALATLQAHRFVVKRPQVGCVFVPVEADELDEIVDLRSDVEERVFASLAERIDEASHEQIKEFARPSRGSIGKDGDAVLVADRDFHAESARVAGFPTGALMIRVWGDKLRVLHAQQHGAKHLDSKELANDHEELIDAITRHDGARSAAIARSHTERHRAILDQDAGALASRQTG